MVGLELQLHQDLLVLAAVGVVETERLVVQTVLLAHQILAAAAAVLVLMALQAAQVVQA